MKWEFAAGRIRGALALSDDGVLYAASEDGFIYALDASGALQWKFNAGPTVAAPSVGLDGTIYISSQKQQIYAINPSGTQQWVSRNSPFAQPYWRGGAVDQNYYYTPLRGNLRAFRLTGSTTGWEADEGYEEAGTVSILPNGLIVFPGPGRLKAVNNQGDSVWDYPAMNPPLSVDLLTKNGGHVPEGNYFIYSGIAVGADGTLFFTNDKSQLAAVDASGNLKWTFMPRTRSENVATPVVAADDTIYFASHDGTIYAVNPDGSEKWDLGTGGAIDATPVLAGDGTIYILNDAALLAVSPEGKLLAKTAFPGPNYSSPTLAPDGSLYAASYAGKIAAFSTTHGKLMDSPWPKFQHDLANSGRAPQF